MTEFLIPTEYARIIYTLANSSSLREAAKELKIDPAALTRKVQKISDEHGLIYKSAQKWVITEKGRLFISWANESSARLRSILEKDSKIRISVYTWMAEQVLLPNFHKLNKDSPLRSWAIKTNSTELEKEIINNISDYAITRYVPTDPSLAHKKIVVQPWVIILPAKWNLELSANGNNLKAELAKRPFIRMLNRNPEDILPFAPQTFANVMVDGMIGIRTAVKEGLGWSCLPKSSVSSAEIGKYLNFIELQGTAEDSICLWWLRSRKDLAPVTKDLTRWLEACFKHN